MAVNKETTNFEKVADRLEPVGKVAKTAGAIFGCLSGAIGLGFKIYEVCKKVKEAKEDEVIVLDDIQVTTPEPEPVVPEEVDDEDFGNLFAGSKEEVE